MHADHPHVDRDDSDVAEFTDEGPGWMPAIMAATLLMGMIGFIGCSVMTWVLFQKRAELALRTVEGSYLPEIEQSHLEPDEKREVVAQLREFADKLARGECENWQAAAVMQRLTRLPLIQWGELRVVEAYLRQSDSPTASQQRREISRLQRAIELGGVTSIDVEDVLKPILAHEDAQFGPRLIQPLEVDAIDEVAQLAKIVADRSDVPNQDFPGVRIADVVQREIEAGLTEGGF